MRRLAERQSRIVCLGRSQTALASTIDDPSKIQIVVGDLTTPESYEDHLADCQTVIHLAAITGKARAKKSTSASTRKARSCLVEACKRRGVKQLLHVSARSPPGFPISRTTTMPSPSNKLKTV